MLPNIDQKPCEHCGRWPNRPTAVDMIFLKDDKILLIKRKEGLFKGFWALPGGHIEYNESIEETLKRELKEETGLTLTGLKLLNVYGKPERSPNQGITIAFVIEGDGEYRAGDDAEEIQLFSLQELPPLAFDHSQIIADYIHTKK